MLSWRNKKIIIFHWKKKQKTKTKKQKKKQQQKTPYLELWPEHAPKTDSLMIPFILSQSQLNNLGPVVQSIISLTSYLVVKMLTVLVKSISNSQVFLLKKCK